MNNLSIIRRSSEDIDWGSLGTQIKEKGVEKVFRIGDSIQFTLKDNSVFSMDVVGLNIYGCNTAVLVSTDILPTKCPFNKYDENTKKCVWYNSELRRYLNEDFIKLLPDEFVKLILARSITQSVIVPEYDYFNRDGHSFKYLTRELKKEFETVDKLWIPSQTELFNEFNNINNSSNIDINDRHFPLFNDNKTRIKRFNGKIEWYPTRTPRHRSDNSFRYVGMDGGLTFNNLFDEKECYIVVGCIIGV